MIFVDHVSYVADADRVASVRPTHREYTKRLMAEGKLIAAGPFTDGSGGLFLYAASSLEEAQAIVANDPYTVGGVIASHQLKQWHVVSSNPDLLKPAS